MLPFTITATNQTVPAASPIVVTTQSNAATVHGLTDGDVYQVRVTTTSTGGTSAPSKTLTLTAA